MTAQAPVLRQHGNAYNIFILVLTIYSLALMVLLILPLDEDTHELVTGLRQRDLRHLPDRLRLQPHGLPAEARLLHRRARLARPDRVDPEPRLRPAHRAASAWRA